MVSAASLDSPAKARPPARSCLLVGELLMVATKRPKCRTLSHAAPARSRCACSNSCAVRHCLRGVNTAHFFTAQSEAGNADRVGELVHKVLGRILQIVVERRQDAIHPELLLPRFEIRRILAGFGQFRITQNSLLETQRDYAVCSFYPILRRESAPPGDERYRQSSRSEPNSLIRRGASREAK